MERLGRHRFGGVPLAAVGTGARRLVRRRRWHALQPLQRFVAGGRLLVSVVHLVVDGHGNFVHVVSAALFLAERRKQHARLLEQVVNVVAVAADDHIARRRPAPPLRLRDYDRLVTARRRRRASSRVAAALARRLEFRERQPREVLPVLPPGELDRPPVDPAAALAVVVPGRADAQPQEVARLLERPVLVLRQDPPEDADAALALPALLQAALALAQRALLLAVGAGGRRRRGGRSGQSEAAESAPARAVLHLAAIKRSSHWTKLASVGEIQ
mmetsp:Transcript_30149/g.71739  ORF Transcript_30149/g.71739 Transcript_30149/m.71739 type:complete len:272 (+) Transcript_30149:4220-5035(+)